MYILRGVLLVDYKGSNVETVAIAESALYNYNVNKFEIDALERRKNKRTLI